MQSLKMRTGHTVGGWQDKQTVDGTDRGYGACDRFSTPSDCIVVDTNH